MKASKLILFILCTVICLCLVACGTGSTDSSQTKSPEIEFPEDSSPESPDEKRYIVVVKDKSGKPVEGVVIDVYDGDSPIASDMTDAEGAIIFRFAPMGGRISLKINTEKTVAKGYIFSDQPIIFSGSQTSVLIEVDSLTTYRIIANDIMGEKVGGMLVELYSVADNSKINSAITDESGIVTFTVSGGEYYVKITHANGNPAFVFVNPDTEGGNTKTLDPKNPSFTADIVVSTADISYSLTVKDQSGLPMSGAQLNIFDGEFENIATVTADASGNAAFSAPNGNYYVIAEHSVSYAYASFEKDGTTTAEAKSDGSIPLLYGNFSVGKHMNDYTLTVLDAYKKVIFFSSLSPAVIEYNGKTYEYSSNIAEPLAINLTEAPGETAHLTVQSSGINVTLTRPGSSKDPLALDESDLNGMKLTANMVAGEKIYYTFIPSKDSTLSANSDNVSVNGKGSRLPVSSGESVIFCITANEAGTQEITLTYGQVITDYTVNTQISMQNVSGVNLILYDFDGREYKKIAEGVTVNGIYTFSNIVETDRYFVLVEYSEYTTEDTYVKLESNVTPVHLVHVEEGTQEYPFSVLHGDDDYPDIIEISLDKGETVWYKLFLPSGYTLSFNDKNASVTVLTDINMNTQVDSGDTAVEVEWDESASAYVYEFEVRNAEDGRIMVFIKISAESGTDSQLVLTPPEATEE